MSCPFNVGDTVRFEPSARTKGLYPWLEDYGIAIGEELVIWEVREDMYLWFDEQRGGWPWNEFVLVED